MSKCALCGVDAEAQKGHVDRMCVELADLATRCHSAEIRVEQLEGELDKALRDIFAARGGEQEETDYALPKEKP